MPHSTIDLDAYLARIAHGGPKTATLATLTALQAAHARHIPFENLDVLLGRAVPLEPAALEAKLVRGGRGGYCFEQNALFLHALRGLGFTAGILLARVVWRRPPGTVTPRTHMLLRVELPDGAYLADVGLGGATPTAPVALVPDRVQPTPLGTYRLAALDAELVLEVRQDGAWTPLYRFGPELQHAVDVELASWYVATHPDSFFRGHLMAARPTATGRHGLLDRAYTRRDASGDLVEQRTVADPEELVELLAGAFGLVLPAAERAAVTRRLADLPVG